MPKKTPSIAEAQALLRDAVHANKHELVDRLRDVRSQLEELVSALGPREIPKEVQRELDALAEIRNQIPHSQTINVYVRNSGEDWNSSVNYSRNVVARCQRLNCLEAARIQWAGRNVSQQFLDRAIEDAFEARKESNATITVLLKGRCNQTNDTLSHNTQQRIKRYCLCF